MNANRLYKLFTLSLFFVLPLSISSAYSDSDSVSKPKSQKRPVEWFFVITAVDAEIKKNDSGQYVLTLEHAKIEKVLAFTDRPNRIVKLIPAEQFKKIWDDTGSNSFERDPPNAVAVFGQEKIAMTLMSVTVDNHKTAFVVTSDDDNMRNVKMDDVSVFVDSTHCDHPVTKSGACLIQYGK